MKLNLGCGRIMKKGYTNVDIVGNPDVKHDLNIYPYPFKDNSVSFIFAAHIVEHLKEPIEFFKECRRIMKKRAMMEIRVPHVEATGGAFGDMTHRSYYHESAIKSVVEDIKLFELVNTIVKRGRIMKWQKREIIWVVRK